MSRPPTRPDSIPQQAASTQSIVMQRYSAAAQNPEQALCCPGVSVDPHLIDLLPREVVEVDYGCGDPTQWARSGEVVLDLGSGSGKACYLLAQKVGPRGRVIGVDLNDAMLALARRHVDGMAAKLGYANVGFVKAKIQDLRTNVETADTWLAASPPSSSASLREFESRLRHLANEDPVVASDSIDLVVSNCVLNLVEDEDKLRPFEEMHRVLRRGGRAVISDIVCDEDPPPQLRRDPELWSGCISGAFREDRFLEAFERAGFHGIEIVVRSDTPWQVVQGIEFRSVTVLAHKGKSGPCLERNQAVIYRGPWRVVHDDDGHEYRRGERVAVCDKTFRILADPSGPYAAHMIPVPPYVEVPLAEAGPFACLGPVTREPRSTKGAEFRANRGPTDACSDNACC